MPPRPVSEKGTLIPRYLPAFIAYAPPGRGSSISYSSSSSLGSTVVFSDSRGQSMKFTVTAGSLIPMVEKFDMSLAYGNIWGSTKTDQVDFAVSRTTSYRLPGKGDELDHDEDQVWFLVKPRLEITATPESYYGPAAITWTFVADQQLLPYFMYVGELRGNYTIPTEVQNSLNRWGIDQQDLESLLATHPFPNGYAPGQPLDPKRFEYIKTFAYRPPLSPMSPSGIQTEEVGRKEASSTTQAFEVTRTLDGEVSGSVSFLGMFSAGFKLNGGMSWKMSTSAKSALAGEQRNTITISQPSFGYSGPQVVRVYEDKLFKTYFFAPAWE